MTLVFPRAMPASGVAQQIFEPFAVNLASPVAGGALYGVTAGLKRWRAEWDLGQSISDTTSDAWRAFIDSLEGSNRTFLGQDFARLFPRLYSAGFAGINRAVGGAFDGSVTKWSQAITADGQALLTLGLVGTSVLPAGFQVSVGDYIDFRWTTGGVARRHMVRFLEAATADGSGIISGATVSPAVHATVVPATAVAHFDNPACVMRLDTDSTSISAMDRRRAVGAKIVAFQDLRP